MRPAARSAPPEQKTIYTHFIAYYNRCCGWWGAYPSSPIRVHYHTTPAGEAVVQAKRGAPTETGARSPSSLSTLKSSQPPARRTPQEHRQFPRSHRQPPPRRRRHRCNWHRQALATATACGKAVPISRANLPPRRFRNETHRLAAVAVGA